MWALVHIGDVVGVLDRYELWKDANWYHRVDWVLVSSVLDESLTSNGTKLTAWEMWHDVRASAEKVRKVDQEGLMALLLEPITVTPRQLTNGGHRLNAMRLQDVDTVPGLFHRGDVGVSIRPNTVYPIAWSAD